MYKCPNKFCTQDFKRFAAVVNHLESGVCHYMTPLQVRKWTRKRLLPNRPIFPSAGPTPRHLIPLEALDSLYQSLASRHPHVLEYQHIFSDDHQHIAEPKTGQSRHRSSRLYQMRELHVHYSRGSRSPRVLQPITTARCLTATGLFVHSMPHPRQRQRGDILVELD
jgi:hypothetical protein